MEQGRRPRAPGSGRSVDLMLISPSGGTNTGSLQSLLQNPQLLQNLIPGVNLASLASTLQVALTQEEAPLQNLSQQQVTLTNQSQAWSQVQSALQAIQNDVQNLSTPQDFNPSSQPVSSDPTLVTASGTGAPPGTYDVTVSALAQPQITNSNFVAASPTTALGYSGTLTLTYNGQSATVTVGSSDSLDTIAQNLNTAAATLPGLNLTASVLPASSGGTSGSELSLSANTGSSSFTITPSANFPLSFTTTQTSQAASYTVNGVANTSPVNTVQNALAPGVSLSLLGVTSSPVSLTVTSNPSAVASSVNQLVTDVQSAINTLQQVAGQGGPLEGNAALLNVGEQLVNFLSQSDGSLPAGDQSLTDMGLSVSWTKTNGEQIQFNSAAFTQALTNNPQAVQSLFLGDGQSPGIIPSLQNYLNAYLTGQSGVIASAQTGITNQEQMLANQQTSLQALVQMEQQNAENQFMAALNTLLKEASLQQSLAAQFALANGGQNGNNNSGGSSGG
jgi:flagellar hook-associated protein 2